MSRIRALLFLLCALLLWGCASSPTPDCGPETCQGCCDASGVCHPGFSDDRCGAAGEVCGTCETGEVCASGTCVVEPRPVADAGPSDGGNGTDAGTGDAGTTDAGTTDAGVQCDPGTHACRGACVPDTSVTQCGATCTACTAPQNAVPVCNQGTCDFTCNTGYHRCGNRCVADTSPLTCGTSCSPCATPANGTATCDGASCGVQCNSGYRLCDGRCAACPSGTAVASTTCSGSACAAASCAAGFHLCNGQCVSDSSVQSCGTSCSPCPGSANGTATCNQGQCGLSCSQGYSHCGDACVPESPSQCGGSCTACTPPANSTALCQSGACGFVCGAGFHRCGSGCCGWRFEPVARNAGLASIQLGANGVPHVAYVTTATGTPELIYAVRTNGAWVETSIEQEPTGYSYQDVSLALDSTGAPVIAVSLLKSGASSSGISRIRLHTRDSGAFTREDAVVDSAVSGRLALALDPTNNRPHVAFKSCLTPPQGVCVDTVEHVRRGGDGQWTREVIESAHTVGLAVDLALDASGNPKVVYATESTGVRFAERINGTWTSSTVGTGAIGEVSLALDALGRAHVSYRDDTALELRYALRGGGSWTLQPIDVSDAGSQKNAIAVDPSGTPTVCYEVGWPDNDVKCATPAGAAWAPRVVASAGSLGFGLDLAMDASPAPHLVFTDSTLGQLTYAH